MAGGINIQDAVLQELKKNKLETKIFLVKGFQLQGKIIDFDTFVVLIESEGAKQMIYKHAISTILLPPELNVSALLPKAD